MSRLTPTEHSEQVCVVAWAHAHGQRHPLYLLTAIPNQGAWRNKRLQKEGTRRGFPDLFLPVPRGLFYGLFIELKTTTGKATSEQLWWLRTLAEQGYLTTLKRSAAEAMLFLTSYINLKKP